MSHGRPIAHAWRALSYVLWQPRAAQTSREWKEERHQYTMLEGAALGETQKEYWTKP